MTKPLQKHTVTYRNVDDLPLINKTVVYYTAVHDRHAELADVRNQSLSSTEQDALVAYQRACDSGHAQFAGHQVEAAE